MSCTSCRNRKIRCDKGDFPEGEACTPCRTKGRHCELYQAGVHSLEQSHASASSSHNSPDQYSALINNHHANGNIGDQLDDIKSLLLDIRSRMGQHQQHATHQLHDGDNNHMMTALTTAVEMHPHHNPVESKAAPDGIQARSFFHGQVIPTRAPDEPVCLFTLPNAIQVLPSMITTDLLLSAFFAEIAPVDFAFDEDSLRSRWYALSQRIRASQTMPQMLPGQNAFQQQPPLLCTFDEAVTLASVLVCLAAICLRVSRRHPALIALQSESLDFQALDLGTSADLYLTHSRWAVAKANYEREQMALSRPRAGGNMTMVTIEQAELKLAETMCLVFARFADDSVYRCMSEAVRMAMELRLLQIQPDLPPALTRRRDRLCWQILVAERYACYICGRTPLMPISHPIAPLQCDSSASAAERYQTLRYSFPLELIDCITRPPSDLPETNRLMDMLEGWWSEAGKLRFHSNASEISADMTNAKDSEARVRGRQRLQILNQYRRTILCLCRPYLTAVRPSDLGHSERRHCLRMAQETIQLLSLIVQKYMMLNAEAQECIPLHTHITWLPLNAFDSLLTLASTVAEQATCPERDSFITAILTCRTAFAHLAEFNVPAAARALSVIDTIWPIVSSPAPKSQEERDQRRKEICDMLQLLAREVSSQDRGEGTLSSAVMNASYPGMIPTEALPLETPPFEYASNWPIDWSSFLNIGFQST